MINCTYILPTTYDIQVQKAFNLVKDYLYNSMESINELQELGRNQDNELVEINKFHYLINYLIRVRQDIDSYFITKESGCLTDTEITSFRDKYAIDCLLEQNVCNRFTNNIVELFLTLPDCNSPIIYEWSSNDTCIEIDGIQYAIGLVLIGTRNTYPVISYNIPANTTVEEIASITGLTIEESTQLLNDRLAFPGSSFCCNDAELRNPQIVVESSTQTTVNFNWNGQSDIYQVTITDEEEGVVVYNEEIINDTLFDFFDGNNNELIVEGLIANSNYTLTIGTENCKGNFSTTTTFSTTPFTVIVSLCETLLNKVNITYDGNVLDMTTPQIIDDLSQAATFEIRWDDRNTNSLDPSDAEDNPIWEVKSVLIGNIGDIPVEIVGDTDFFNIDSTITSENNAGKTMIVNNGGTITIPALDASKTIDICGGIAEACLYTNVIYTDISNNDTLTITYTEPEI